MQARVTRMGDRVRDHHVKGRMETEREAETSSHSQATNKPLSITQLCPSMLTYCELNTSDKINPSPALADQHRKGQRR